MIDTAELDELVMNKILGKPNKVIIPKDVKVIDSFRRKGLNEGRDHGLGYSILHKESDTEFKALMAFTACKDYLNDFVYVETTGKSLSSIYGFKHNYTGLLKGKEHFYLGLRPLNYLHGSKYSGFEAVSNSLKDNNSNIIKYLNNLEDKFKVNGRTTFETYTDDILILKVPMFWIKFPFMFSLYGLLVRCFLNITKEELEKDPITTINDKKSTVIVGDNSLLSSLKNYLDSLNPDKLLDYQYPTDPNSSYIHNFGIIGRLNTIKKK